MEEKDNKAKINNYLNDIKKPASASSEQPKVDPTAAAPAMKTDAERRTIGQAKSGQITQTPQTKVPLTPQEKADKAAKRKKALIKLAIVFGIVVVGLLVFAFLTVAGNKPNDVHLIARIFGMSQATFINSLIVMSHLIFTLFALVIFVFTMIGLIRTARIDKEDKPARKSAFKKFLLGAVSLFIFLILWLVAFIYLDTKVAQMEEQLLNPIMTEPEDTINLTAPVEIRFDASNVPLDRSKFQIISYDWDFDDGETGTSQIVTHKFEDKGLFNVVLSVTKLERSTNKQTVDKYTVVVSVQNQALTASFTADPQSGEAPLKVKFDASDSVDPDGTIDRYEWDFDNDGDFDDAEGVIAEHEFERLGTYTVSLRVVSTTDEFNVTEKEIEVVEQAGPKATISIVNEPKQFVKNTTYVFRTEDESSTNGGKIVKYSWNFGDNTKLESTKTVSHSFKNDGTYLVTLTLIDEEGEEGEVTKTITVGAPQDAPTAKISTTPIAGSSGLQGTAPFTVTFDGSGSTDNENDIVDYQWDFDGDGSDDAFGKVVTHTFPQEGTFTVTLLVRDADKNADEEELRVTVGQPGITAVIRADKTDGNVPLTVSFDATGSSYPNGRITSYRWDFGDGTQPKLGGSNITHRFDTIGTYKATVTAFGDDNSSSTASVNITVREIPLAACFTAVFMQGSAPLNNSFDPACTTGTVSDYFWDFGDGGTSTDVKPSHTFNSPGTYTVTLEVTDADNTVSQTQKTITVTN